MRFCAMLNCENESNTNNAANGGVSYHQFPKKRSIKNEWIKATGRENWRPSKSSTICTDHFDESEIQINKKGYKYLIEEAIPNQKIRISQDLQDQIEKQKDFVENEARPAKKMVQNKKGNEEEEPAVMPGASETMPKNVEVKKEIPAPKPRASNKLPINEVEVEGAAAVKLEPHDEEAEPAAQPEPSMKRPYREGDQEEEPATKKAYKEEDPEPNQDPPKLSSKEKVIKLLRWDHEKIRKQQVKIKSLQTANRNLAHNVRIIEEFVKLLEGRIDMTHENLLNVKMTIT